MTDTPKNKNQKRIASKAFNEKNHTHFKHFNKADPNTRAKSCPHEILKGIPAKLAKEHRTYQKNLLLDIIGGRSWVITDILHEIRRKKLAVLYTGAKGIVSEDPHKYISNLLDTLRNEHKIVRVFECVGASKARWRFIPNKNIASRALAEILKVDTVKKIRYCIKCIISLKRI